MIRKLKITEEQYNHALKEGVTLTADLDAANGDVKKAVEQTKQTAQKSGVDLKKATIQMPADTSEGKLITKKQLTENRLKALKECSMLYHFDEFIKQIKK